MPFPIESPATLSQDDVRYLEEMFTQMGPSWEEIDTLFLSDAHLRALHEGYSSLFFLRDPATAIRMSREFGLDGRFFHRFLALRHPLEARTLSVLRLIPFDPRAVAHVVLPYYRQRYAQGPDEETWAFLKAGSRIIHGVIIHPSTKELGRWQVTYFDRDGLDRDESWPKGSDTLLDLFARRYVIPAPDVVDALAVHCWR